MRVSRRELLVTAGMALAAGAVAKSARAEQTVGPEGRPGKIVKNGRLRQSVSRWCYRKIELPDLCKAVAAMGVPAIDLLEPVDWPIVRDHGLICSMGYGGG